MIYGTVTNGNTSATAGVQRDDACFNQYFCNGSGGPPTGGWALVPAGTPTPDANSNASDTHTANCYPNSDSNSYGDSHSHSYRNANSYGNGNAYTDSYCHGDSYCDGYCDSYGYCYRNSHTNGHGDPHGNAYAHADSETHAAAKKYA